MTIRVHTGQARLLSGYEKRHAAYQAELYEDSFTQVLRCLAQCVVRSELARRPADYHGLPHAGGWPKHFAQCTPSRG